MFSIKGKLGHSLGFEWKTIRESSEDKWLLFQKCHCQKKKKNGIVNRDIVQWLLFWSLSSVTLPHCQMLFPVHTV